MENCNNQAPQKPALGRLPSPARYDDEDEATFALRVKSVSSSKPSYHTQASNLEVPQVPFMEGTSSPLSPQHRGSFVPYRRGAVWPPKSNTEGPTHSPSQSKKQLDKSTTCQPLTADTVRWPLLDDDEKENDEMEGPTAECPAVPLREFPLRRRSAVRRPNSSQSNRSGRLPSTPTDEDDDILSPLSQISRDPLGALERRRREREQSWSPGDDDHLTVKNVQDSSGPRSQG